MCDNAAYEDVRHMITQCSSQSDVRHEMYDEINKRVPGSEQLCSFDVLLGNQIEGWECSDMLPIWLISGTYIVKMYYEVLNYRKRFE